MAACSSSQVAATIHGTLVFGLKRKTEFPRTIENQILINSFAKTFMPVIRRSVFSKFPWDMPLGLAQPIRSFAFALAGLHLMSADPLPVQKLTLCDEPSFRNAVEQGGTIQCDCEGTLILSSELVVAKDTIIDCSRTGFTLSGNQTVRVLHVNPGVSLTLLNLKIKHGKSSQGGGLFNDGGQVTVSNCVFESNLAAGATDLALMSGTCSPETAGCVAEGGAVYTRGFFTAIGTTFSSNAAVGYAGIRPPSISFTNPPTGNLGLGGRAAGGAIRQVTGIVDLRRCAFDRNRAEGGMGEWGAVFPDNKFGPGPGGDAQGGCVDVADGELSLVGCLADANAVRGGRGSPPVTWHADPAVYSGGTGGTARGAVLFCANGRIKVRDCYFRANLTQGGDGGIGATMSPCRGFPFFLCASVLSGSGGPGGDAQGGAVFNAGQMETESSSFFANHAKGGDGGTAGDGVGGNDFGIGYPGGGGVAGKAAGGAVFNRNRAVFQNCTWVENQSAGGNGGNGGAGGMLSAPTGMVAGSNGGSGGPGGDSQGGAVLMADGSTTLINCTLATNRCVPGHGGAGGIGNLVDCSKFSCCVFCTPGSNGAVGRAGTCGAGGLHNSGGTGISLVNTLLAHNLADTNSSNASGSLIDLGHNLSSDGTCSWTQEGSRSQIDPRLGPLGDHGGPTPSFPLLADSPARDSGSTLLGPTTDPRGVVRPFGPATDIGAFEYEDAGTVEPFRLAAVADGAATLRWTGGPGIRVQRATSLNSAAWDDVPDTLGKHSAVLKPEKSSGYYRLHKP